MPGNCMCKKNIVLFKDLKIYQSSYIRGQAYWSGKKKKNPSAWFQRPTPQNQTNRPSITKIAVLLYYQNTKKTETLTHWS